MLQARLFELFQMINKLTTFYISKFFLLFLLFRNSDFHFPSTCFLFLYSFMRRYKKDGDLFYNFVVFVYKMVVQWTVFIFKKPREFARYNLVPSFLSRASNLLIAMRCLRFYFLVSPVALWTTFLEVDGINSFKLSWVCFCMNFLGSKSLDRYLERSLYKQGTLQAKL